MGVARYTLYKKQEDGRRNMICSFVVQDKFDAPKVAKVKLYRMLRTNYGAVSIGNWMRAKVGREIKARYVVPGRGIMTQRFLLVESRASGIFRRPAIRRHRY